MPPIQPENRPLLPGIGKHRLDLVDRMPGHETTIEVDSQTAKALADYAAGFGLSVPELLRRHFVRSNGASPIDDVDAWLDEISEGSEHLPPLPQDFSTKDIYADHD